MNQLLTKGRVTRGALGIDLHPIFTAENAVALGLDRPYGAWVGKVYPGSPAFLGGLHDGDVVVKYQGVDVQDLNHLINMVSMTAIGQAADLEIWRDRQRFRLRITIGDRERAVVETPVADRTTPARRGEGGLLRRPVAPEAPQSALGVELRTIDEAYSRQLGLPTNLRGAVVVKVEPNTPAASALKVLDVIHSVNGKGVATAEEAVSALGAGAARDGLTLGFDRVVKGAVERRSVRLP
jgi:serine protease Do